MTDQQNEALKRLYKALNDITEQAEQDENFNIELAEMLQQKSIKMSLDDLSYIIGQHLE